MFQSAVKAAKGVDFALKTGAPLPPPPKTKVPSGKKTFCAIPFITCLHFETLLLLQSLAKDRAAQVVLVEQSALYSYVDKLLFQEMDILVAFANTAVPIRDSSIYELSLPFDHAIT